MGYTYVSVYRYIKIKYICFVVCYTIIYIYIHMYIHIEYVYGFLWARPISIVYIILILWVHTILFSSKYIDVVCATLIYVDRPLGSTVWYFSKAVSVNKQRNKTQTVSISKFLEERHGWLRLVTNKSNMNTNNHCQ